MDIETEIAVMQHDQLATDQMLQEIKDSVKRIEQSIMQQKK